MEVKFDDGTVSMELNVVGLPKEVEKELYDSFRSAIDKATHLVNSDLEENEQDPDEEEVYKAGYQALVSNEEGLHHPESEFEEMRKLKSEERKRKNFGMKVKDDGNKRYQLYYICDEENCGHKGKRYVPKGSVYTNCHECGHRMNIRHATDKGFGFKDEFSNYYIAGSFERNWNSTPTLAGTHWN